MRSADLVVFAFTALTRARGRALTLLVAVSLSVASVLLLTALGEGARGFVAAEFKGLGKDLLVMFPGRRATTGGMPPITGNSLREITLDDMAFLQQRLPNVWFAPLVLGFAEGKQGGKVRQTMLLGSTNRMRATHNLTLLRGQWLPGDALSDRQVTVLGEAAARELFGTQNPIGQWVRFDNRKFRVVGLFTTQNSNLGMNMSEAALIPVATAMRLFNAEGLFRLLMLPVPTMVQAPQSQLISELERLMASRHGSLDVTVLRRDSLLAAVGDILRTLSWAVIGIGAISLLVSGIMMMNLALISTRQRTAEIGLLKALGASPWQIRALFLAEALLLSAVGALLGLLVGYGLVGLGRLLWPTFPLAVPALAALAAVVAALGTGLFFCWLPAQQAAKQEAVASLRANAGLG
ncbi:MAG: ABC transporter permease [Aeromonas sp.]